METTMHSILTFHLPTVVELNLLKQLKYELQKNKENKQRLFVLHLGQKY